MTWGCNPCCLTVDHNGKTFEEARFSGRLCEYTMKNSLVATAAALVATLSGCDMVEGKHEVGECVHTRAGVGGTEIVTTDCPAESGFTAESIADPVYRISQVLEIDGHCPTGRSFGGIELRHEPDDAVYCLEMAGV